MDMTPQILFGKVMHKRLAPKINSFTYGLYYIAFPLSGMASLSDGWRFGVNRPGILSFYAKDHGDRQEGGDLELWARTLLREHMDVPPTGPILLLTMARVLGYVFNPVSFWLCHDNDNGLRAVICEVNNTFGESHAYICAHDDGRVIANDDEMTAEKLFHVSPFLERAGGYRFRFAVTDKGFGAWIDFHDPDGGKRLLTALTCTAKPWTRAYRRMAFWRYPLVTLKAVMLIHWQAVRLIARGIAYVPKPIQIALKNSRAHGVTKS